MGSDDGSLSRKALAAAHATVGSVDANVSSSLSRAPEDGDGLQSYDQVTRNLRVTLHVEVEILKSIWAVETQRGVQKSLLMKTFRRGGKQRGGTQRGGTQRGESVERVRWKERILDI